MKMHLGNLIRYYVLSMAVRWGFTVVFEKGGAQHKVETAFVLGRQYSEKIYKIFTVNILFYPSPLTTRKHNCIAMQLCKG